MSLVDTVNVEFLEDGMAISRSDEGKSTEQARSNHVREGGEDTR